MEIQHHQGAFVARPSPQHAREIIEARALLEPRTAHLAALNATSGDVSALKSHIEKEQVAMAAADRGLPVKQRTF